MPLSIELAHWLQNYFLPVAADPNRPDVAVANVEKFMDIVETYKVHPCLRKRGSANE
jgi:hypothetical protein